MKKKEKLFLVLSILVVLYLVFGLFTMIGNISNYSPGDFVAAIVMYGLFVWIGLTFFKKYKKYSEHKHVVKKEKRKFKIKPKRPLTALVIFVLMLMSLGVGYLSQDEKLLAPKPVKIFSNTTNINLEKTEKALEILEQCEIEPLDSIEYDPILDDEKIKGYRLESRGVKNIILYMNEAGEIDRVNWADNYFYKDGEVISKITDYKLTRDEMIGIRVSCQESIKSLLKSPSTAKFPGMGSWDFSKNNGEITVRSYVDAQNSFGAKLRNEFQFKIKNDQVISLIFDGKEHVK